MLREVEAGWPSAVSVDLNAEQVTLSDDEIREAALMAKHTMGWSTYLNTEQYDYDGFKAEFDQIAAHVKKMLAEPARA